MSLQMTLGCESSEREALGFTLCYSLSLEDDAKRKQHKQEVVSFICCFFDK